MGARIGGFYFPTPRSTYWCSIRLGEMSSHRPVEMEIFLLTLLSQGAEEANCDGCLPVCRGVRETIGLMDFRRWN